MACQTFVQHTTLHTPELEGHFSILVAAFRFGFTIVKLQRNRDKSTMGDNKRAMNSVLAKKILSTKL